MLICEQIFDSTYTESDWVYPPVAGQRNYIGSATYWAYSQDAMYYNPAATMLASNMSSFPLVGVARSYALSLYIPTATAPDLRHWWWLGDMTDGTKIPNGKYVMRVAALRPFGDRTIPGDWDATTLSFVVAT